ncbi:MULTISPECIES: restriction endonuclease subunit S [unclassified Microbulbifer]|uniref:restriction endonuclease subunit S n=1 Tax=unclassified Microbulbifer TaxID=2619833 RepID=UPI0027E41B66|nr:MULTISPECIES: restriction endonuclease subunit S [unclassified Microbulbifer]
MAGKKLSAGWCTTELHELGQIVTGKTPSTKNPDNFGGDIPFIKPGDLDAGGYIRHTADSLTKNGASSVPTLPEYSIAVTCIGNLGKVGITTSISATNQQINSIIPSKLLDYRFLYHQLCTLKPWLESEASATTVAIINKGKFSKAPIALPSIAEQKVIADKLDTLLVQVENTKARLERIPQILKRFRQSVLATAVTGKLTEDWRGRSEFASKAGALKDFVAIDVGHAFKSKEFTDTGIRLLRGQNIEPGALKWKETKYFPEQKLDEFSHLFLRENDVILAMDRPIISTGLKLGRVKPIDLPCVLVQRVARFKDFSDLSADYLYLLLSDLAFTNYIQPNQTGSDIPHISGKQILAFPVKIPSLEEQEKIVQQVEQLFTYADTIEKQVNNALARVDHLGVFQDSCRLFSLRCDFGFWFFFLWI